MQKAKGIVVYSLFFFFEGSFIFSEECGVNGVSHACFKYSSIPMEWQNLQDWRSYRKIDEGFFESLENLDGQYAPKSNLNILSILSLNSTLALKELWGNNAIFLFKSQEGEGRLFADFKNSTLVGNIGMGENMDFLEESVASLTFSSGKIIEVDFLKNHFERGNHTFKRKPSQIIDAKYQDDRRWALIGSISNHSGKKATLTFRDGAKMIGDLYANHSEISITFQNFKDPVSNTISFPVVFDGGIYSRGGRIELSLESGGIKACPIAFGDYGIFAENNGVNKIEFIEKEKQRSQYLFATQIVAHTTSPKNSHTENFIIFKNSQSIENNLISVYDVIANSGKNIISTIDSDDTSDTELALFIKRSLLTSHNPHAIDYPQDKIGNQIIIDGGVKIGEYVMRTLESDDEVFGIMAWGGKNTIILKDTNTQDNLDQTQVFSPARGAGHFANRFLATPRIYAGRDGGVAGENEIDIDGNLILMYLENPTDTDRGIIGGEIIATDGGKNTILVNGLLEISGYRRRIDDTLGVSPNDEIKRDDKELLSTLIGVYGNDPSTQNTLFIKNTDVGGMFNGLSAKDLVLGSIVAYGGKNQISLYSSIFEDFKGVEIKSLIAGDTDFRGIKHAGGINKLTIYNGMEIVIKKILTHSGGINHLWILQDEKMSDIVQVSELGFVYEGGETFAYFGNGKDKNTLSSAIKINLQSQDKQRNLVLNVMKNKEEDYETYGVSLSGEFFGGVEHIRGAEAKGSHIEINYALEGNTIFVGDILSDETIEQNILIGDNTKFAPKNEETIYFETLLIDTPSLQEPNLLKKTQDLKSSVIDLATGGDSFSNITNRSKAKMLDIGTFMIYKSGNYNPLMRFYVSGKQPHQADRVSIETLRGGELGLDAQIFLPTHLIGYDFSEDNVVIFSAKSGGEDLQIQSQTAQTGIVSYVAGIIKEGNTQEEGHSYQWRLGKSQNVIISPDFIHFAGEILAHNYSLFHIHFSSSIPPKGGAKRMQGVWSKVFGGEQSNSYAYAGIKSKYLVLQAGYDNAFDTREGRDFTGFMASYGVMDSKSQAFEGSFLFDATYAYRAFSHSAEFGVYNLYFHNSGFYTNTLAKLGYLSTRFNGINDNSVSANLSNYTLTLSQGFGYKIEIGKAKEWFITPQVCLALGYLSPSKLRQSYDGQTLQSSLNGILTLKNTLGSEIGYTLRGNKAHFDFKVGLGYGFDYAYANALYQIEGGTYIKSVKEASFISPSHQFKLNAGIDVRIDDRINVCLDVQKSFFGKINTDYQISAGIRYSFGERETYNKAKEIYTKLITHQ
ncbi:autotransporter outer membrane beta-barrel domain-containing protein [Helicobacter brantae]|uniref:Autotransporter domain-containing protein n=1 Tax=Helicobacter brantae TaxID=375927 RepID=A0A3D8J035_9HELI|nr:autotransporter outer membrane beta-barrel domain-containing protein [Helicobacter brantae]RDU70887.1 hypothetical protein CQA58_03680 [Helicobacter brantae]